MLQLTPQSTIYVASTHVDFRKGIDGLAAICRQNFATDPFNGSLFLFYNRSYKTMKILFYDGQGFCLFMKRISKGKFNFKYAQDGVSHYKQICYRALHILINNGNPSSANLASNWRTETSVMPG